MRLNIVATIVSVGLGVGCASEQQGPDPLIICHNGNCAGPTDPFRDGTMAALRESLALRHDGRPTIDGVELDFIWHSAEQRCVYGHDLHHGQPVPAAEAAQLVAAHISDNAPPAYNGTAFYAKIELKRDVGPAGEKQTWDDREQICRCALEVAATLADAAHASGHKVIFLFHGGPDVLQRLMFQDGWPGTRAGELAEYRIHAEHHAHLPAPVVADVVSVGVEQVRDGYLADLRGEIPFLLDMFDVTVETLATIEMLCPGFVGTNEAPFMRRWLATRH